MRLFKNIFPLCQATIIVMMIRHEKSLMSSPSFKMENMLYNKVI